MIELFFITQASRKQSQVLETIKKEKNKKDFNIVFPEASLIPSQDFKDLEYKNEKFLSEMSIPIISKGLNFCGDFIIAILKNQYDILSASLENKESENFPIEDLGYNIALVRFYSKHKLKFFKEQIVQTLISSDKLEAETLLEMRKAYGRLAKIVSVSGRIKTICESFKKAGISAELMNHVQKVAKKQKKEFKNQFKNQTEDFIIDSLTILEDHSFCNVKYYKYKPNFSSFKELIKDQKDFQKKIDDKIKDIKKNDYARQIEDLYDTVKVKFENVKNQLGIQIAYEENRITKKRQLSDPTDLLVNSINDLMVMMKVVNERVKNIESQLLIKRFLRSYTGKAKSTPTGTEQKLINLQKSMKKTILQIEKRILEQHEQLDGKLKKKLGGLTTEPVIVIPKIVIEKLQELKDEKIEDSNFEIMTDVQETLTNAQVHNTSTGSTGFNFDDFGCTNKSIAQQLDNDYFDKLQNKYSTSPRSYNKSRSLSSTETSLRNPIILSVVGCGSMLVIHKAFIQKNEPHESDNLD